MTEVGIHFKKLEALSIFPNSITIKPDYIKQIYQERHTHHISKCDKTQDEVKHKQCDCEQEKE